MATGDNNSNASMSESSWEADANIESDDDEEDENTSSGKISGPKSSQRTNSEDGNYSSRSPSEDNHTLTTAITLLHNRLIGDTKNPKEEVQVLTKNEVMAVLVQSKNEIESAKALLRTARDIGAKHGFSIGEEGDDKSSNILSSSLLDASTTSGGHSNTDHLVKLTGDFRTDRIQFYKHTHCKRLASLQRSTFEQQKWDNSKRIPGQRRRRLARQSDVPSEPPISGYVCFVYQMTTKIRHDRRDQPHDQTKVMQEISNIWKLGMSDADREYYNIFTFEIREEYMQQMREYKATGHFAPSEQFERLGGGPWVRIHTDHALELELRSYDTVKFPPRPADQEEAYQQTLLESKRKRKRKLQEQKDLAREQRATNSGTNI